MGEKCSNQNNSSTKLREFDELYQPEVNATNERGMNLLTTSYLNKGMAFTLHERQRLGIHGLLPPAFMTGEQQANRVMHRLRQQPDDLARFIQLDSLHDRNEKLFYRVLRDYTEELLPIVYTPTVGLACEKFGIIYRKPKGLYVTINDNSVSKIYQILSNWPRKDVRAIVVTDGERILGLGDLGAYGMGIPVGKLALYVALARIQPKWCLPVVLDCGTDNEKLLNDPFYTGLRRNRVRGAEYESLVDNFMKACTKRYGPSVLVQFEDFSKNNAYSLLTRYQRMSYCMFNDDIQGTAAVVVAGLLACERVTKRKMSENRYLFLGAGSANVGAAELCVLQMLGEGLSYEEACARIYIIDSKGLITLGRGVQTMGPGQVPFAKDMPPNKDLLSIVKAVKPNALIGASTIRGAFTEEIMAEMARINARPIIFALSNPTSKAECTAEEAYRATDGTVLFASGSPFKDVQWKNRVFKPGQGNNAYIFPGVALATVLFKISIVDNRLFLMAAKEVASAVTEKQLSEGRIYPTIPDIPELSVKIAVKIGKECYKDGTAKLQPEPVDKEKYIRAQLYSVEYEEYSNETYDWPEKDMLPSQNAQASCSSVGGGGSKHKE